MPLPEETRPDDDDDDDDFIIYAITMGQIKIEEKWDRSKLKHKRLYLTLCIHSVKIICCEVATL